jgi:hypothetical protein
MPADGAGQVLGDPEITVADRRPVFVEPGRASGDGLCVLGEPGHTLFIDWDDALRAVRYRVIVTNAANPPVELKNEIVSESEVTYNDLPAGSVKITVASRNSKEGESAATAPVNGTVP